MQWWLPSDTRTRASRIRGRSEEHTSELQSRLHLVCRLLLGKKKCNSEHFKVLIHIPVSERESRFKRVVCALLAAHQLEARRTRYLIHKGRLLDLATPHRQRP